VFIGSGVFVVAFVGVSFVRVYWCRILLPMILLLRPCVRVLVAVSRCISSSVRLTCSGKDFVPAFDDACLRVRRQCVVIDSFTAMNSPTGRDFRIVVLFLFGHERADLSRLFCGGTRAVC